MYYGWRGLKMCDDIDVNGETLLRTVNWCDVRLLEDDELLSRMIPSLFPHKGAQFSSCAEGTVMLDSKILMFAFIALKLAFYYLITPQLATHACV